MKHILASPLLFLALCASFEPAPGPIEISAGRFTPLFFQPLRDQSHYYSFDLRYGATLPSSLTTFRVRAVSSYYDPVAGPVKREKILYDSYFRDLASGDSLTIQCAMKPSDWVFSDRENANRFIISALPDAAYKAVTVEVPVNPLTPQSWVLPSSLPLARSYPTEWKETFDGKPGNLPFAILHEGFAASFEDPFRGLLPLRQLRLRNRFCDGSYLPFTAKEAKLYVLNHIDDFSVGAETLLNGAPVRSLSLDLIAEEASWSHLALSEPVAVSLDERTMKPRSQKGPRDFLSTEFYLPPVKSGEPKTFSFLIVFSQCGDENLDSIAYAFSVLKTRNHIGSKGVSDWHVEETEA
jgi:hypothetical protein